MRKAAFTPNRWLRTRRRWRRWRAGLRPGQLPVALCLLLTIGLGEPLLCVLHCQLWMPLAHRGYFAAQHQHSHAGALAAAPAPEPAAQPPNGQPGGCFMLWGGDGAPARIYVPPSPVRELLLTLPAVFVVIVSSRAWRPRPTRGPPRLAYPPLLRPPIAHAA